MEFRTNWNRHLSNSSAENPADFVHPGLLRALQKLFRAVDDAWR
jgi:hypothetical protein